jgi:PAS domain S-box-containing protein
MADQIHSVEINNSEKTGKKSGGFKPQQDKDQTALPLQQYGPDKLMPGQTRETASSPDNPRPLYNSRIIITYVEYLRKYHPHVDIDFVLQFAGMTRHEVDDPGHWFNQQQTDKFNDILVARTGNPRIARDAGRFTISCNRLGPAKQYALGLINLASVYLMVGKLARTMSRGARMTAKKLAANKVEMIPTPQPGTVEKPYQCENRMGSLESVAGMFTNKFAEIEHPDCLHSGHDHCRYIVTWEKTPSLAWKRISHITLIIGVLFSLFSYHTFPDSTWHTVVPASAIISMMLFLYAGRLEKRDLVKTIETQGNAAEDLMDEMNVRHSNALLIQEIGQAVTQIPVVDRIVATVVGIMEKHLFFDRGLIMLADPAGKRLKFIAGFGYNREQSKILQNTEFNLDNPRSKGHFVRCFNEQKPFLVNDVSEIEQDLSPKSREFINQMAVQSFVCVPIVYEKTALGILAVENTSSSQPLAQSEISVLMGVASQTAASIINARSFKEIKKSEQRYRLLADNITDVIWTLDLAQSRFTYFSPSVERFLGFTPEEILQLELQDILTPDSFEQATKVIADELAREQSEAADPYRSRTLEIEQYRKDGTTIWSEVTASFLRNPSGEAVAILGALRDISERKQAEQEKKKLESRLQQAHKMEAIGTLAGGIAHDFNNILAAALGYTEMALGDVSDGSMLHDNLQEVLNAGNRAKDLVKQILAFSRQADQELMPVQVKHVVKEAVRLLRLKFGRIYKQIRPPWRTRPGFTRW